MTQLSGNQFEDDLTVGMEESNAFSDDTIDLFGISGEDESPIARLKSIILSIDWEISDEILKQLDDELLDLGEIWAGDKIKQVYVQGLSKIGKYIFKEKAGAHPDAIKLLLRFFHNLETIVVSEDSMGEEEKKKLLLSDVKKFDRLKAQIGKSAEASGTTAVGGGAEASPAAATGGPKENLESVHELKRLKALVLGIDWEITDLELENLESEVKRLQKAFAADRPKIILLQGIGALSAYVNKMRSKSNGKAFTLLRSFYNIMEQISGGALSASEQKELLLAEVSKFNQFKAEIAGKSPSTPAAAPEEPIEKETSPAAMSAPEESTAEEMVSPDDDEVSADVSSRLSSVFGDGEFDGAEGYTDSDKAKALEGVNVETEADDDSDEEALPYEEGGVAPALAEIEEDSSFSVEKLASDLSVASPTVVREAIVGEDIELEDDTPAVVDVDDDEEHEAALMGVDVETEADDDSDEESLPMSGGTLAPALSDADFDGGFDADSMAAEVDEEASDAIESRLGDFFDDEVALSADSWGAENEEEIIEEDEEPPGDEEGLIAALSEAIGEKEEDDIFEADESSPSALSQFDDSREESEGEVSGIEEEGVVAALSEFGADDEAEPALGFAEENPEEEESLVAALSQFDDGVEDEITTVPSEFDTTEEIELKEEVEETVERGLDFLDEEPEEPASQRDDVGKVSDEEIAFEVESEDLSEDDEIEFTVPGTETLIETDETAAIEEELGEFGLPGKGGEEVEKSDEVVFEAVDDDVALDLLPGEEFDDSHDLDIAGEKEGTQLTAIVDEIRSESVPVSGAGKYESLATLAARFDKNVVDEGIQDFFVELNKQRNVEENSYTDKTFLQLLYSVCQYLEKNPKSAEGISLVRDIVSGLEMNAGSNVSSDKVQESLFSSTSRFLVLQRKEIDSLLSGFAQEPDSQTASYFQKELADIRKLFVEEIGNLRKELSGR